MNFTDILILQSRSLSLSLSLSLQQIVIVACLLLAPPARHQQS